MQAIRFSEVGAPEVLRPQNVDAPPPAPEELQIRVAAAGVNFIDVAFRRGFIPVLLPGGLGLECAGEVAAVGSRVTGFAVGDRVACGTGGPGAYGELYNVSASRVAHLPSAISYEIAAAVMMKGLTSDYLLNRVAEVGAGTVVLFHAAAGGVGSIACQWAKALGATVIGTTGSDEKRMTALQYGCDFALNSSSEDITARVREITGGRGVDVVFDSVGQAVFEASIQCLARYGSYVSFGQASGPVPSISADLLRAQGLWFTSTNVYTYTATADEHAAGVNRLFDAISEGRVRAHVNHVLPLREAAKAHRMLEDRKTTGSIILVP